MNAYHQEIITVPSILSVDCSSARQKAPTANKDMIVFPAWRFTHDFKFYNTVNFSLDVISIFGSSFLSLSKRQFVELPKTKAVQGKSRAIIAPPTSHMFCLVFMQQATLERAAAAAKSSHGVLDSVNMTAQCLSLCRVCSREFRAFGSTKLMQAEAPAKRRANVLGVAKRGPTWYGLMSILVKSIKEKYETKLYQYIFSDLSQTNTHKLGLFYQSGFRFTTIFDFQYEMQIKKQNLHQKQQPYILLKRQTSRLKFLIFKFIFQLIPHQPMKSFHQESKQLILTLILFLSLAQSMIPGQEYRVYGEGGIESDWIVPQSDLGDFPSQYFLCGISLRESLWTMLLYNCDCGPKFHRWRISYECNWCNNFYWTEVGSIKATFCSANNWNMQIDKFFDTGNPNYRQWRQVKCPPGQYASKITGKLGSQLGVETGFVGVKIKCENLNFTESTIVEDGYTHRAMDFSKNKQGKFVSAVGVKYIEKQKIVGMRWNFESVVNVSKITAKYVNPDKAEIKSTVIESTSVANKGPLIIQKIVIFSKPYTVTNNWRTDLDFISKYPLMENVRMPPFTLSDQNGDYSIYGQNTDKFQFGKERKTIYEPNEQVLVLVDSNKVVNISTVVEEKKIKTDFEAVMEFSDAFTGQVICERTVKGKLEGTVAASIKTLIGQEPIPK